MWDKIKNGWRIIIVSIMIAGAMFDYYGTRAMAQSHDEIIKGQYRISQQNTQLISNLNTELQTMYKLGAISKETFNDLRMLPTEPTDSEGNMNKEWYLVGDDGIYLIKIPDSCDVSILKMPIGVKGNK